MKTNIELGHASIDPDTPVVAGSYVTLRFTYTAGHPVDDSGCVKIVFRQVGDFGTPQFDAPSRPNYCTVRTNGRCSISPRWDRKGHIRPWSQALYLRLQNGFLDRGETITVTFGDTSEGSPGWKAQTFVESTFEFRTFIDPIATYTFKPLKTSPCLAIIPGPPVRAVCLAPSQAQVGEPFSYLLKLEDRWGNPTGEVRQLEHPGFRCAGVETVRAQDDETGLSAQSNPIGISGGAESPQRLWADFHGQSEETIGTNTIRDYYAFARDAARLDIAGHQGNDFQVTDEFWSDIRAASDEFHRPGRFVTFAGYEWSGNTPLGGDRNVYFAAGGGTIARSCRDLLPDQRSICDDAPTADDLFASLREQAVAKPFVFAHVGGRYADLRLHDPEIEVAAEIHSAWGTFEWLLEDALRLGYRIGICANSDGHKGRPGASYPGASTFGSYGGLTCVRSSELTRDGVYEALRARHCYATTGHRPLIDLEVSTEEGRTAVLGDVLALTPGSRPLLHVWGTGTASIESIVIRNGLQILSVTRPAERPGRRVRVAWSGAEVRGRDRAVAWHGSLSIRGNRIQEVTPINLWNPEAPLERIGDTGLRWKSMTTGGVCGAILTLENENAGILELETAQGDLICDLASVSREPAVWSFGGLNKQIEISRLPDTPGDRSFSIEMPLEHLKIGDNPIYVRVAQEDGHMAWTSPLYLVVCGG